jgi:toxin ParE1/3/4
MTPVFRSPAAERDPEDIWLTIAADDPTAATRIVHATGARIDRLGEYPRLGPRRPDVRPTMRVSVETPYLILFETHPDEDEGAIDRGEILRVVDGRRNLSNLI